MPLGGAPRLGCEPAPLGSTASEACRHAQDKPVQAEVLMYLYVFSILNDFLNLARGYTFLS